MFNKKVRTTFAQRLRAQRIKSLKHLFKMAMVRRPSKLFSTRKKTQQAGSVRSEPAGVATPPPDHQGVVPAPENEGMTTGPIACGGSGLALAEYRI